MVAESSSASVPFRLVAVLISQNSSKLAKTRCTVIVGLDSLQARGHPQLVQRFNARRAGLRWQGSLNANPRQFTEENLGRVAATLYIPHIGGD
jgi:hypothetical protein